MFTLPPAPIGDLNLEITLKPFFGLDYAGDLDAEFEWARFIGDGNAHVSLAIPSDSERKSLHARADLSRPDAALRVRYRDFAAVIRVWREAVDATTSKAGFARRHGILSSDTHRYAGFPEGISQGPSLGTFLVRQFCHLARDLGIDAIRLSNGFVMKTWKTVGPIFGGTTTRPASGTILRSW